MEKRRKGKLKKVYPELRWKELFVGFRENPWGFPIRKGKWLFPSRCSSATEWKKVTAAGVCSPEHYEKRIKRCGICHRNFPRRRLITSSAMYAKQYGVRHELRRSAAVL